MLILDEPTNDLDTDMLAAIEDLLDSYAGTLLVVSHDRYLIERVTDQQYAVMGGRFLHLPRGVEQYLELRSKVVADEVRGSAAGSGGSGGRSAAASSTVQTHEPQLRGAELRNAEKEFSAAGRKIEKLQGQIAEQHLKLAEHDQSDYAGLGILSTELTALESALTVVETRWLELSELLG